MYIVDIRRKYSLMEFELWEAFSDYTNSLY